MKKLRRERPIIILKLMTCLCNISALLTLKILLDTMTSKKSGVKIMFYEL